MAINFDKYLYSTGTHYISNSGHDERRKYTGGAAGDQSGDEWSLRSWYNRPWSVVLRYPDKGVALTIARLGIAAALNDKIGYDQNQRLSYWKQLKAADYDPSAITTACEEDCTAGVSANVKAAGYLCNVPALKNVDEDTYSVNMRKRFVKAGFVALTEKKYLDGYNYLLPGDILLYENHHAATNITNGKYAVFGNEKPANVELGDRILRNGCEGEDVRELQTMLIKLGYSCGSWGADGEFGDATEFAVRRFQTFNGLDVDGEVGEKTLAKLKSLYLIDVDLPREVLIVGGNCYIRTAPNTSAEVLGVAVEGKKYPYGGVTAENGWLLIEYDMRNAWVSGKYGRLTE